MKKPPSFAEPRNTRDYVRCRMNVTVNKRKELSRLNVRVLIGPGPPDREPKILRTFLFFCVARYFSELTVCRALPNLDSSSGKLVINGLILGSSVDLPSGFFERHVSLRRNSEGMPMIETEKYKDYTGRLYGKEYDMENREINSSVYLFAVNGVVCVLPTTAA